MSAPASGYTAIPISPPHDEDDDRTDHDAAAVAADRLDPPPAAAAAPADAADPNAAAPVDPNAPIPLTINNFLAFAEAAGSPDSQVVLAPRAGAVVNLLGTVRNTIVWIHWLAWYAVFAYMTFAHPRPQPELESGSCSRLAFIVHFWFVKMTISGVAFFFEKKHALVRTVSTVAIYVGLYVVSGFDCLFLLLLRLVACVANDRGPLHAYAFTSLSLSHSLCLLLHHPSNTCTAATTFGSLTSASGARRANNAESTITPFGPLCGGG
ncbi:hypothetical protein DFJ73DRAFT_850985 [Zopfochytrium polystomum]|nr:hypothetical protein DFJ73DRAFT_850985 [Zopfochytrium polystomum]